MQVRNKLIGKIHVLKTRAGFDDDLYRIFLKNATGKISCKDMNYQELLTCIKAFNQSSSNNSYIDTDCSKLRKILKLWVELGRVNKLRDKTTNGLNRFLENRFNTNTDKLNNNFYFNNSVKDKIIESLKSWLSREEATH